jgi:hypothetical protein
VMLRSGAISKIDANVSFADLRAFLRVVG